MKNLPTNNDNNGNLASEVMAEIKKKKVSMLPHFYFVAGSVLLVLGILAALLVAAFAVGIFSFHYRVMRPMGLSPLWATGPLFVLSLGLLGIIGGIALIKKYDFSYRRSFVVIALAVVVAIAILGIVVDSFGFDRRPPRPMMRAVWNDIPEGDWLAGQVVDILDNGVIIKDPAQATTTIVWDEKTKLPPLPLEINDFIRAIGEMDDGVFHARFVGGNFGPRGMRMMR